MTPEIPSRPESRQPPETVGSIAALVGGEVVGDPARVIRGVNDLRLAGADDLGFLNNARLEEQARTSRAAAILVHRAIEAPAAQIVVDDVYAAFARVAQRFHPAPRAEEHEVHASAVVADTARLCPPVRVAARAVINDDVDVGAGTIIAEGAVVGAGCRLGADCVVHPNVVLYPGVRLGDRVIVHAGAIIGADGFGYAREADGRYLRFPQMGTVVLEDDVEIGANSTIDRGALGPTRIGRGSKIDNLVHIGHNCRLGRDVAIAGMSAFAGSTVLGDRVAVGGHTVFSGHIEVADDVRIGGNSVVYQSVRVAGDYMGYPLMPKRNWLRVLRSLHRMEGIHASVRRRDRRDPQDPARPS